MVLSSLTRSAVLLYGDDRAIKDFCSKSDSLFALFECVEGFHVDAECFGQGVAYRGVSNVGTHPTVDVNAPVNGETYLLDFQGDLYGKTLTVSFLRYLRGERRFDTLEDLRRQIESDIAEARK